MHSLPSHTLAWIIWLSYIGITPKKQREIIHVYPTASNVLESKCAKLNLGYRQIQLLKNPQWNIVEQSLQWAKKKHNQIITSNCALYPRQLLDDEQFPNFLFLKGDVSLLKKPQIAIVGSRNASNYGLRSTEKICAYLLKKDYIITSGMALGIDAMAHQSALLSNKPTIAILGLDIENIYPKQNQSLYLKIQKSGLIISSVPIGTPYRQGIFPERNRIISALSKYVVVIEASEKSGALHTVSHALKQNRTVYALPGRIDQPQAQGCNRLIQMGAQIITRVEDLVG
ncbi:MAG: DNA-processing protein DprA [Pseudomonadota bacterium]|nr:DNA-processing protein DprA [Pseudomonadota bacterium]